MEITGSNPGRNQIYIYEFYYFAYKYTLLDDYRLIVERFARPSDTKSSAGGTVSSR
jgi:hypothetical protein